MERERNKVQGYMRKCIAIFLLACPVFMAGQDHRSQIYDTYLSGRMDLWKKVMDQMESDYSSSPDMVLLYDLAEAQYGYIGYCISVKRKKDARLELGKVDIYLDRLLKYDNRNPRIYCLVGAFYGLRVGLDPIKAPVYGKRAEEAIWKATELGPDEPQAWLEKANGEFYKPAIFGGSVERAVPLYEKAVRLYEENPNRTKENWLYLNCLAGLGIAYEKNGQVKKAGEVYRKLLELEPSFKWIRDELYPRYLEKL